MPAAALSNAQRTRSRIIYISYEGVGEPLGRSQVLAYLARLASTYDVALISFEQSSDTRLRLKNELSEMGIEWLPRRYHRRPPVLSTAWDIHAGRRALIRAAKRWPPQIIHVRSDVPALMAVLARRRTNGKLLFDIRGFWADERVEGGLWRPGGLLYRLAKRCERRFYAEADAIVTLTQASVPYLRAWTGQRSVPIQVIPTCVDLRKFAERPQRPDGPHAVWSGSIGTWYRFDLARRVAQALALPLTVVTRQVELARRELRDYPSTVRSVTPDEMPDQLFSGDIGLCLIASRFSKTASAPTRFAEYLAAGMPVVVTKGVGDLETVVEEHQVGAVLHGEDDRSLADAAAQVRALAADQTARKRCQRLARERYDVDAGASQYASLYQRLIDG